MNEKKIPWYQRTRRFGQTNLTEDDPLRNNVEFWERQWDRTRVQGVIINCGGIVSYYPSRQKLQYKAATLGEGDYYRVFSEAARKKGLTVIARMDINRADEKFFSAHPDWFCVDKNGDPYQSQGRFFSCINSDYYKKYIPEVLKEIIEFYHPDGFADNSWMGMGRQSVCYCESCRKKFFSECGTELPEAPDFNDPIYRRWIRWSMKNRYENWVLFNKVTTEAGGADCLWLGMINASPVNQFLYDMKEILEDSRIVLTDHQSRDALNGFEQNHENGDLLHMASDENIIIPESLANYVRGNKTFRLSAAPYEEVRMWTVSGAAGGISPWFHHIGGGTRDRRQFESPVPFFAWHEKNEEYLYDRRSLANVAVVWSQDNAVFYGRNDVTQRVAMPWRGIFSALHAARIPALPIHIRDLLKYSKRINTFIFPDIAAVSDEAERAIIRLMELGKNVVITGLTGEYDADGQPREHNRILEKIGIRLTGESFGSVDEHQESWENPSSHSYFALPDERNSLFEGFEDTEILPFGGRLLSAESAGILCASGDYVEPFPIYPPEFSWIRHINREAHPIYSGKLSSGSKVVYFAADIDRVAGKYRLPDHLKLLSNAVRMVMTEDLPVVVEGSGRIDIAVFRQGEKRIIHLTNLSGMNEQGYLDQIIPLQDLAVILPSENRETAEARFLVSEETHCTGSRNGKFVIRVKQLKDFEVIVV